MLITLAIKKKKKIYEIHLVYYNRQISEARFTLHVHLRIHYSTPQKYTFRSREREPILISPHKLPPASKEKRENR